METGPRWEAPQIQQGGQETIRVSAVPGTGSQPVRTWGSPPCCKVSGVLSKTRTEPAETPPVLFGCCPNPTLGGLGHLPASSGDGGRNSGILQPCRGPREADLMEIPFHVPGSGVSSLARACGGGRRGGGTLGSVFTELLPNHRKSQLLGMKSRRRRRKRKRPRLCQLLSTATSKRKPEHCAAALQNHVRGRRG